MFYRFSLVAIAQYSSICVSPDARSIAIQNKQHPNFRLGLVFALFWKQKNGNIFILCVLGTLSSTLDRSGNVE
jgi:hypothetical protein